MRRLPVVALVAVCLCLLGADALAQEGAASASAVGWETLLTAAGGSVAATSAAMYAIYRVLLRPHVEEDVRAQVGPLLQRIEALEKQVASSTDPEKLQLRERIEADRERRQEERIHALEQRVPVVEELQRTLQQYSRQLEELFSALRRQA